MKKKILTLLLCGLISCTMLTACGNKVENTAQDELTDGTDSSEEVDTEELIEVEEEISEADDSSLDVIEVEEVSEEEADTEDAAEEEDVEETAETKSASLDVSEPLTGLHHAQIDVQDYGIIELELDADTAPISVTNFVKLAQENFYDGLTFHRIISGF
ncbi:MAG: peptidylprolyl isomerase, partial [Eubacteriales bacterium]|nr:peptidylprolyl isomerase [Eubacteriales bacterium]